MKKSYAIGAFVVFIGVLILLIFVPDYQEKNSQTEILAMFVASNEVTHGIESSLILDKDSKGFVYSGEAGKDGGAVDPKYHISIGKNGRVTVEYNDIMIIRTPILKEGKLQWSCIGTPKEIMPESCK